MGAFLPSLKPPTTNAALPRTLSKLYLVPYPSVSPRFPLICCVRATKTARVGTCSDGDKFQGPMDQTCGKKTRFKGGMVLAVAPSCRATSTATRVYRAWNRPSSINTDCFCFSVHSTSSIKTRTTWLAHKILYRRAASMLSSTRKTTTESHTYIIDHERAPIALR